MSQDNGDDFDADEAIDELMARSSRKGRPQADESEAEAEQSRTSQPQDRPVRESENAEGESQGPLGENFDLDDVSAMPPEDELDAEDVPQEPRGDIASRVQNSVEQLVVRARDAASNLRKKRRQPDVHDAGEPEAGSETEPGPAGDDMPVEDDEATGRAGGRVRRLVAVVVAGVIAFALWRFMGTAPVGTDSADRDRSNQATTQQASSSESGDDSGGVDNPDESTQEASSRDAIGPDTQEVDPLAAGDEDLPSAGGEWQPTDESYVIAARDVLENGGDKDEKGDPLSDEEQAEQSAIASDDVPEELQGGNGRPDPRLEPLGEPRTASKSENSGSEQQKSGSSGGAPDHAELAAVKQTNDQLREQLDKTKAQIAEQSDAIAAMRLQLRELHEQSSNEDKGTNKAPALDGEYRKPDLRLMAISVTSYCETCLPFATVRYRGQEISLTDGDYFRGYRVDIRGDRLLLRRTNEQHSYYPES